MSYIDINIRSETNLDRPELSYITVADGCQYYGIYGTGTDLRRNLAPGKPVATLVAPGAAPDGATTAATMFRNSLSSRGPRFFIDTGVPEPVEGTYLAIVKQPFAQAVTGGTASEIISSFQGTSLELGTGRPSQGFRLYFSGDTQCRAVMYGDNGTATSLPNAVAANNSAVDTWRIIVVRTYASGLIEQYNLASSATTFRWEATLTQPRSRSTRTLMVGGLRASNDASDLTIDGEVMALGAAIWSRILTNAEINFEVAAMADMAFTGRGLTLPLNPPRLIV